MLVILTCIAFYACASAYPTGRSEVVYPTIETLRSGEKRLKLRALDQDIELRLKPAGDIVSENFFIQSESAGRTEFSHFDINAIKRNLYKDSKAGASLHINEEGGTVIKGILNHKLRILPHETEGRSEDGRVPHQVLEVEVNEHAHHNDYIVPPGVKLVNESAEKLRSGQCTFVEITIVTDTYFSQQHPNDRELTNYIMVFINGVQLRYESVKPCVKHVLVSIIIVRNAASQPYIQNNIIPGYDYAHCDNTLWSFAEYCSKQQNPSDIIKLITKRPIAAVDNGKVEPNVIGIAYVGGVCDNTYKVGISEDDGKTFSGVITCAHENAHLLGCPHDGDGPSSYIRNHPGSRNCPWDDGFIMSYVEKDTNRYLFSSCSQKNMEHLSTISSCLRQNNTRVAYNLLKDIPGEYLEKKLKLSVANYVNDKKAYYDNKCNQIVPGTYSFRYPEKTCGYACRTPSDRSGTYTYYTFSCEDGDMCSTNMRCIGGICQKYP